MTFDGTPAVVVQTGKDVPVPAINPNLIAGIAVTFPQPYPTPPTVVLTPFNGRLTSALSTVTTTGFTAFMGNFADGTTTSATTFNWIAIP